MLVTRRLQNGVHSSRNRSVLRFPLTEPDILRIEHEGTLNVREKLLFSSHILSSSIGAFPHNIDPSGPYLAI